MKNKLMTLLLFFLMNSVQKFIVSKGTYQEITQLQLKLFYLIVIKTCRLLFISSLGIGVSLILFLSSLALFYVTFFIYSPFSMETKMWVGFVSAAVYLLIAAKVFLYVFAEEKWLRIFHAKNILNQLNDAPESEAASPAHQ